jgi:16S rRNA G966 N2-methylase RsmD
MLTANFKALEDSGPGKWNVVQADVYDYLKRCPRPAAAAAETKPAGAGGDRAGSGGFNLILEDPPYDESDLPKLLSASGPVLADDGIIVFEMRSSDAYTLSEGWNLLKEKNYGETKVLFLERGI